MYGAPTGRHVKYCKDKFNGNAWKMKKDETSHLEVSWGGSGGAAKKNWK